jgi:threonine dehydratase
MTLITLPQILAARETLAGYLHRTPTATSTYLGGQLDLNLYFKLELLQKTGSFKPRGVLNRMQHLSADEKARGVITLSAGNAAQAVAWAAKQAGVAATVVMPAGAVQSKVEATRGYGGEVIQTAKSLLDTCLTIQRERNLTLVHPFDDLHLIAGHGTAGLELLEDVPHVDVVIVGVGGGGLISGVAAALKSQRPSVKVIGVEPEGASAMTQSLAKGEPVHLSSVNTIADGLAAPFAGQYTLAHVQAYVDEVVLVSDEAISEALGLILERCKVLAEPAAASTLAALWSGAIKLTPGSTVVCILSGGNIDRATLKQLL